MARLRTDEHARNWCIDMYLPGSDDPRKRVRSVFDTKEEVIDQLKLIFEINKKPIKLIEVKYRNKVVKKWENLNV